MKFKLTRRDVLGLAGGTAVGAMLTPAPWKAVDDLAIWTQNWKWIPKPPKGEITAKATACTLCPAGCATEARCVAGFPVSLRSAAASAPGLCPAATTAHHLPYHPARLTHAIRLVGNRRMPSTLETAISDCATAIRNRRGNVAVLDMRPGRSVSAAWRQFVAAIPDATFIAAPGREGSSLTMLQEMLGSSAPLGIDFERARAILSFGAPVAEGWGTPRILQRLSAGADSPLLIHVEPVQSQTAQIANRWLPAKPGTEGALALAIAHVLIDEGLIDRSLESRARDFNEYKATVERHTPEAAAKTTGIPAASIVAAARELSTNAPVVVLAGESAGGGRFDRSTEAAILGLNILLGSIDVPGGIVQHDEIPSPIEATKLAPVQELESVPNGSIAVLLIDASAGDATFPWKAIERKLTPNAFVAALSPYLAGTAGRARVVIPTTPFLETDHEIPNPIAPSGSFGISAALLPTHDGAVDPAAAIRSIAAAAGVTLDGDWAKSDDLVTARIAKIHAAKAGSITAIDGSTSAVGAMETPDTLRDALKSGGRWNADVQSSKAGTCILSAVELQRFRAIEAPHSLTVIPVAARDVVSTAVVSPVLTKIYQESSLRPLAGTATLNPVTAREFGLTARRSARLSTASGTMKVTIATDPGVMPGVVALSVAPDPISIGVRSGAVGSRIIDICPVDDRGVWRAASARLEA